MRRMRGFSLVELVVTIVIAAIVTAIAIPMFDDAQIKQSWYHEQMKAALRYAQRQAVAQRRCVYVQVTATQLSLLYGNAGCTGPGAPLTFLATIQEGKAPGDPYVIDAPSGTSMSPAPTTFSFNGLGQPSFSTPLTLNAGSATITIASETGYVQ